MFKLVVLSCIVALAAANPSAYGHLGLGYAGLGWGNPLAAGLVSPHLASPVAVAPWGLGAHGIHGAYNYRGPLSLAPGQPANILAADGRPLDTLSVNLDRAAHITAKAVDGHGIHLLKKRSAHLLGPIAPLAVSHSSRIDYPGRLIAPAPLALAGPLGVAPLGLGHAAPWGLGVGHAAPLAAPWGFGLGHGAPLGHLGLGHAAPLGHLW